MFASTDYDSSTCQMDFQHSLKMQVTSVLNDSLLKHTQNMRCNTQHFSYKVTTSTKCPKPHSYSCILKPRTLFYIITILFMSIPNSNALKDKFIINGISNIYINNKYVQ